MGNSGQLNIKIDRKRIAVVEEDFLTRKLLATTINSFFEDLEACPYESYLDFNKSNLTPSTNKISCVFLSLKSFYSAQNNFSPETTEFLKNSPTIIMSHNFSKNDLSMLNDYFVEEPIILNKPFKVKDIINLTEWTIFKSKMKKEFSDGFKKKTKTNVNPVVY